MAWPVRQNRLVCLFFFVGAACEGFFFFFSCPLLQLAMIFVLLRTLRLHYKLMRELAVHTIKVTFDFWRSGTFFTLFQLDFCSVRYLIGRFFYSARTTTFILVSHTRCIYTQTPHREQFLRCIKSTAN